MTRIDHTDVTSVIIQNISGDLRVRGHNEAFTRIDGDNPEVIRQGPDAPVIIHCQGDCSVKVPESVPLSIGNVGGDAKVTNLRGDLSIESVGSDLIVRHIEGNTSIQQVGSDLAVKHIDGDLIIGQVGSDFLAQRVSGDLTVEQVGSDIVLTVEFDPDNTYSLAAGSDIAINVPPDSSFTLHAPLDTPVEFDELVNATVETVDDMQLVKAGDDDSANIYIRQASEVAIAAKRGFGDGIHVQIDLDDQMRELEVHLNESLGDLDQIIDERTKEAIAKANELAGKFNVEAIRSKAERARQQAERHASRARRHAERMQRHSRRQHEDKWEPVSNEERLMILKMLEDGQISIDEAEQLLNTLEGN